MKRTQLNLDERTYYHLVSYARREKTSISHAARKLISRQMEQEYPDAKEALLGLAELGKRLKVRGPHNLSEKIDYYLYGEGNPKFRTKRSAQRQK